MKGKILFVSDPVLFMSRGLSIYSSFDNGESWSFFCKLPSSLWNRLLTKFRITSRLFRLGVHHFVKSANCYYIIYNKNIIKIDSQGRAISEEKPITGSRPLGVIVHNEKLIYGEYSSNNIRGPISVFSFDGFIQEELCVLEGIRHVHGVYKDPFSDSIYFTTGDYKDEAGIWKYLDGKVHLIAGGGQQQRAVQLLFTEDYIYYGTDTPLEDNFIYRIDKLTNEILSETHVSSSIFYGAKVTNKLFFSTVIEPSNHNSTKYVEVWMKSEGSWSCIKYLKKDILPMKFFQYGQVLFPTYDNYSSNYLWFYKQGVSGCSQSEKIKV